MFGRYTIPSVWRHASTRTPALGKNCSTNPFTCNDSLLFDCLTLQYARLPRLFVLPRQNYRIEYPSAFLLEVASSMTEVLQGPPDIYEGQGKGRVRCISTPLENEVRRERGQDDAGERHLPDEERRTSRDECLTVTDE